jgi:hypothetical protein
LPEFPLAHTQRWIDHFASHGHDATPLAAEVEGAIYYLGRGLIAKVWRERRPAELQAMQSFYADVAAAELPFRTPEILAVEQADSRSVTYERKLPAHACLNKTHVCLGGPGGACPARHRWAS